MCFCLEEKSSKYDNWVFKLVTVQLGVVNNLDNAEKTENTEVKVDFNAHFSLDKFTS